MSFFKEKILKTTFRKTDGHVTECTKLYFGNYLVFFTFLPKLELCVYVQLNFAERNISKECIKWNQNQEVKTPLFAAHALCSWKVQGGNCINLYSEGYKSAEGEIMIQFS